MKNLLILLFIILFGIGCVQGDNKCDDILNKTIGISESDESLQLFKEDFKTLLECKFDSIDYYIFAGPHEDFTMVSSLLIELSSKDPESESSHTYNEIYKIIKEFQQHEDYSTMRKTVKSSLILKYKKVDTDNWETDRILLSDMGLEKYEINAVFEIISKNPNKDLKYFEVLQLLYSNPPKHKLIISDNIVLLDSCDCKTKTEFLSSLYALSSYDEALKCSKQLDKSILLYFNAYGCVNAREIEDAILSDDDIKTIINNQFVFANLFVDDQTLLPKEEWHKSEYDGKIKKKTGQKNADLQITKFSTNAQPSFFILTADEELIANKFYDLDKKDFINFLKKGIK